MDVRFRAVAGVPVSQSLPLTEVKPTFGTVTPIKPVSFEGASKPNGSKMTPATFLTIASLMLAPAAHVGASEVFAQNEQPVVTAEDTPSKSKKASRSPDAPSGGERFFPDRDLPRMLKWAKEGKLIPLGRETLKLRDVEEEVLSFLYREGDYQAQFHVSTNAFEDSSSWFLPGFVSNFLSKPHWFLPDSVSNSFSTPAEGIQTFQKTLADVVKETPFYTPSRFQDDESVFVKAPRPDGAPKHLEVFSGKEGHAQIEEWVKNGTLRYYLGVEKANDGRDMMSYRYRDGEYQARVHIPLKDFSPKKRQAFREKLESFASESGRSLVIPGEPGPSSFVDNLKHVESLAEEGRLEPTYTIVSLQGQSYLEFRHATGSGNSFYVPDLPSPAERTEFLGKLRKLSGQPMSGKIAPERAPIVQTTPGVSAAGNVAETSSSSGGGGLLGTLLFVSLFLGGLFIIQRHFFNKQQKNQEAGGAQGAGKVGAGSYKSEFDPILDSDVRFADVGGQDESLKRMKQDIGKFQARRTRLLELKKANRDLKEIETLIRSTKTSRENREALARKFFSTEPNFEEIEKEARSGWELFKKRLPAKRKALKAEVQRLTLEDKKAGGKPDGVLMAGPPGTGKTLLAAAVAGEAGVPFISVDGSGFDEKFVGIGAARVRDMFARARELAEEYGGVVLFIDEIDGMTSSQEGSLKNDTLAKLKAEMESLASKSGIAPNILMMAATNKRTMLDDALTRPGRFGTHLEMKNPANWQDRLEVLKIGFKLAGLKMANVDVDPAEITAVVEKAVKDDLLSRPADQIEARYKQAMEEEESFNDEEREAIRLEYEKLTGIRNSVGVGKALEGFAKRMDNSISGAALVSYVKEAKLLRERQLASKVNAAIKEAIQNGGLSRPAKEVETRYQNLLQLESNPFEKNSSVPRFTPDEQAEIRKDQDTLKKIQEKFGVDELGGADTVTEKTLTDAMFNKMLGEVLPPDKWPNKQKHELILLHEFGHGINALLAGFDIDIVSGEPRSGGVGGFVMPNNDSNPEYSEIMPDLGSLLSQLFICMGGKAFEIGRFGRKGVTWGSSSDREKALDIIRKLITSGMVEEGNQGYKFNEPLTKADAQRSSFMLEEAQQATMKAAKYLFDNHQNKLMAMAEDLVSGDEKNRFGDEAMALFEKHLGFPKVIADRHGKPDAYRPEIWEPIEQIYNEYLDNDVSWTRLKDKQSELNDKQEEQIIEQVMGKLKEMLPGSKKP